jgi:hypothetical protein
VEKHIAELRRSNNILLTALATSGASSGSIPSGRDFESRRGRGRGRGRGREKEGEMELLKERRSSVASVGSTHDEGGVGEGSVGGGSPMLVYRREREGGRDGAS